MKTRKTEIWCQKQLADEALHQLLEKIDNELAEAARKEGCRQSGCEGKLHRADYDRKPRGGPQWTTRYSFCCAREECRRRMTPASVRYLGRKVYAGFVVVLLSAMSHGLTSKRVGEVREKLGVDRRTLERWRQWWLETFVGSRFWKEGRARFSPPVEESTLPWSLVQRFGFRGRAGLLRLLRYLAPITVPGAWGGPGM